MSSLAVSISEVVDLLGLERNPRSNRAGDFTVRCPFCGDNSNKYHMSISENKQCYHCFKCDASGGVLDLYGRVALGEGHERGPSGNGKRLYQSLMHAMGFGVAERNVLRPQPINGETVDILPESDDVLDKAYSAVLAQPWFTLSKEHEQKLLQRGLSKEAIIANGYRTCPHDYGKSWFQNYDEYKEETKRYMYGRLEIERRTTEILKNYTQDAIVAGMCVAYEVRKQGIKTEGVPGFYKLGDYWVFRLDPGMFVPTRNQKGKIIALQMRRDYGTLRYMTVSSKGLDKGPTAYISRPHFCLHNDQINKNTMVLITEGPLKADVALNILQSQGYANYAIIALHGVNNRNEVDQIFGRLKESGVRKIYNAFDMDRLQNPAVMSACGKIEEMANEAGIKMDQLQWDPRFKGIDDFLKAQYIG